MFNFSRENTSPIAKWLRNVDKSILLLFLFLFLLGLFFSFSSTSSVAAEKMNKDTYYFFYRHFFFVLISLFLLVSISIPDKKIITNSIPYLFYISILLLFLVPIMGVEVKGSKRWLDLYFLPKFQPIELVKPLFIVYVAKIITSNEKGNIYYRYLFSFLALFLIIIFLIYQPDIGQTLLLSLTWVTMIFVSGFNMFLLLFLSLFFLSFIAGIIFIYPEKFGYIFFRIKTFIDPSTGGNFQSQKALDAIKQGGLTGQGMGEGILKDKVPEAHTDYIIAVISEEFGAILVLLIVIIFLYISYKILDKVFEETDEFHKLVLVGLLSLIIIQTLIHIGVNIRLLPTTGMTLPFLSYGGSSLIGNAIIVGIILNFTRKDSARKLNNE